MRAPASPYGHPRRVHRSLYLLTDTWGPPSKRHSQDATCARGGAVHARVESRGAARSSVLRGHAAASRTAPRPCAPASVPTSQPSGFSASEQGIRSSGWKRIRFSTSERKRELALKFSAKIKGYLLFVAGLLSNLDFLFAPNIHL